MAEKIKSDPVLMYIETPFYIDLEVISVLKALKGVILTMNNEDSFIKKSMGNGADGYLLKKADWEESYNHFTL
ncbi:MAG: DNA-binding NarL/FixJ family response regulator [Vicingaceae bacterium]